MTQPKSKSSKSKSSKKTTTASTAKKVKRAATAVKRVEVELEMVATPEPIFTAPAPAVTAPVLAPVRLVTRAEFMDLVRKEAYRRYAARRSFKQGSPFQDWVNAEAAVSGKLAAEGARLS